MDPKRRLKDIDVYFISLVEKGANKKKIIYKGDNFQDSPDVDKIVSIRKVDEEKRIVYGIVYSPEETDSQGDVASAQEIEKAAYAFMKNARTKKVDKNHDETPDEGYIAESWITKEVDALFSEDPQGSWAVGIKVEKDDTWDEIKKGGITGFSLMGRAAVEQVTKKSNSILDKIKATLGISKDFKEQMAESQTRRMVWDLLDAFSSSIHEILNDENITDKKASFLKVIEQMKAYVDTNFETAIAKDFAGLSKEGRVISTRNVSAIKGAIKALQNVLQLANTKITKEDETEMNKEEITALFKTLSEELVTTIKTDVQKMLDDKMKPVEEVQKSIDTRLKKFEESPGSKQQKGQETPVEKTEGDPAKEKRFIFS